MRIFPGSRFAIVESSVRCMQTSRQGTKVHTFKQDASLTIFNACRVSTLFPTHVALARRNGPSRLVSLPEDKVWEIDSAFQIPDALKALQAAIPGAAAVQPGVNCRGVFCTPQRPPLPTGRLTAAAMCSIVAALQPADCVLVDESLTSGPTYWQASKVRAMHDAIGYAFVHL